MTFGGNKGRRSGVEMQFADVTGFVTVNRQREELRRGWWRWGKEESFQGEENAMSWWRVGRVNDMEARVGSSGGHAGDCVRNTNTLQLEGDRGFGVCVWVTGKQRSLLRA